MPTLRTYLGDFRLQVSDDPEDVEDRVYTDRKLARFMTRKTVNDHNAWAPQQFAVSGSGPEAIISPAPTGDQLQLLTLYWAKGVYEFEKGEAARVGFSVSNVAGRVDGRERFITARENLRDTDTEIKRRLKKVQRQEGPAQATWRKMERNDSDAPSAELDTT